MSKRYGRNQKRAHRARIAELERSSALEADKGADARRKYGDLQSAVTEWDDEIRRLLGTYSALRFKTQEMETSHPIREMAVMQEVRPWSMDDGSLISPSAAEFRERMCRWVLKIEEDPMQYRRLFRFTETNGTGMVVAYSLSMDQFMLHGFGPRDELHLAREIARRMVQHVN